MKALISLVILALGVAANAQTNRFPPINLYTGDPTGVACIIENSLVQSSTNGSVYSCHNGAYQSISHGGAAGTDTQIQRNCLGAFCGSAATLDAGGNLNATSVTAGSVSTPGTVTAASANVSGTATAGNVSTAGSVAAGSVNTPGSVAASNVTAAQAVQQATAIRPYVAIDPDRRTYAVMLGDSICAGSNGVTTARRSVCNALISKLKTRFGDGGTAMFPHTGIASLNCAQSPVDPAAWGYTALIAPSQAAAVHATMQFAGSPNTITCQNTADSLDILYATNTDTAAGFGVVVNGVTVGTYGAATSGSLTWAVQHIAITTPSGLPEPETVTINYPASGNAYIWGIVFNRGSTGIVGVNPSVGGTTTEQYNAVSKLGFLALLQPNGNGLVIDESGINDYSFSVGTTTSTANKVAEYNYVTGTIGWPILQLAVPNIVNGTTAIAGSTQADYQTVWKTNNASYTNTAYYASGDRWGTFDRAYKAGMFWNSGAGQGGTCTATLSGGIITACACSGGTGYTSAPVLSISPKVTGLTLTATIGGGALTGCSPSGSPSGLTGPYTVYIGDGVHPDDSGADDVASGVSAMFVDSGAGENSHRLTSNDGTKPVLSIENYADANFGATVPQRSFSSGNYRARVVEDLQSGIPDTSLGAYPTHFQAGIGSPSDVTAGIPGSYFIFDAYKQMMRFVVDPCGNVSVGAPYTSSISGGSGLITTPCAVSLFQVLQPSGGPGLITVTASGTAVVGDQYTEFTNSFAVGSTVRANGETRTISAITDDQHMTTDAWTNTFTGKYTLYGASAFVPQFVVKGWGGIGLSGNTQPQAWFDFGLGNPGSGTVSLMNFSGSSTSNQAGIFATNNAIRYSCGGASCTTTWGQQPSGSAGTYTRLMTMDASGDLGVGVTTPLSKLDVNGSEGTAIISKTGTYTATISDSTILGDATSASFTVTLPQGSATALRRKYCVKKIDASVNTVTIAGASGLLDGAANRVLSTRWTGVCVQSNGTDYFVVGSF